MALTLSLTASGAPVARSMRSASSRGAVGLIAAGTFLRHRDDATV